MEELLDSLLEASCIHKSCEFSNSHAFEQVKKAAKFERDDVDEGNERQEIENQLGPSIVFGNLEDVLHGVNRVIWSITQEESRNHVDEEYDLQI